MGLSGPFAFAVAAALAVAACGQGSNGASDTAGSGGTPTPAPTATASADDGKIDCALAGSSVFVRTCTVERATVEGKLILVVRHPDGAFRRFEVVTDGRGVIPADGAQNAATVVGNGVIDVTVGNDRYRFPATISNAGG